MSLEDHQIRKGAVIVVAKPNPYVPKFNEEGSYGKVTDTDKGSIHDINVDWYDKHNNLVTDDNWMESKYFNLKDMRSESQIRAEENMNTVGFQAGMTINKYVDKILELAEKAGINNERAKALKTFRRCILPNSVKEELDEALTLVLRREKFEEWGVYEHFEKGLTNSVLLYGAPGTGKTMVSESIAAVLGKNLMTLGSGDIQSPMPGKTEQNIREAFKKATETNSVLLLDECDSLLGDRNQVGFILGAEINTLLAEIERFEGVVLLTTNRIQRLDPALERRIVAKVELKEPTPEARKVIWSTTIPPKTPVEAGIDYERLASLQLAGGDIKNAVLLAIRKAVSEGADRVTAKHLVSAAKNVYTNKQTFREAKDSEYRRHVSPTKSFGDKVRGV